MSAKVPLRTDDLDYLLPSELIATHPAAQRDQSRLMVIKISEPGCYQHKHISDLPELLQSGDLLVLNETRVIPARITGIRKDTGGKVSGLYLNSVDGNNWSVMLKSNGKLRVGLEIQLQDQHGNSDGSTLQLRKKHDEYWSVTLVSVLDTDQCLQRFGLTPLPPYILNARNLSSANNELFTESQDRLRYQTVFARHAGAVAAPTAGLHFTDNLLQDLHKNEIDSTKITLHVGAGTFKPISTEFVQDHPMHKEYYEVPRDTLVKIRQTRGTQGRIIAVGTTSVRTLESLESPLVYDKKISGETDLLITPGYKFKYTDALLTNFHLPRSSLLALVASLTGLDTVFEAYNEALREKYRFYSYGDAMLILP